MLAAKWIPKLVFDSKNIYKQKYIHSLLHIKELGRDVSANYIFCGVKIIRHIYITWFQFLWWSNWHNSHVYNKLNIFAPYLSSWGGPGCCVTTQQLKRLSLPLLDSVQHQHIKSIYVFMLHLSPSHGHKKRLTFPFSETDSEQLHALLPKTLDEVSQTTLTTEK